MATAIEVICVLVTVITVLRVEHLFASNVWIARHGPEFIRKLRKKDQAFIDDPTRVWPLYLSCGAHNVFLFFGIKSYLLLYWSIQSGPFGKRVRAFTARTVRFWWRYFVYPVVLSAAISVFALFPEAAPYRSFMLTIAFLLNLGSIAIAAESVLSAQKMDTWANWYHRWPEKPHKKAEKRRTSELKVYVGSGLISLFSAFALIVLVGTQFSGFRDFPARPQSGLTAGYIVDVYVVGLRSTILSFLSIALNEPTGTIGSLTIILVGLIEFSYVTFAFTIVGRLWS
ncbi:hypothetical protein [Actinopolymorpha rutila]|uniref:Uncharacterized protein n=1 Tax=Actinopolymorpha rutila TaxID=446787 RepID=A0A852ZHD4_9ACTN|nr:hypothetical protein [Actinopolymorpha rutila]NYH91062.1 hypothetical protein [Actinopolymorpha rutila]